ncbi:MAG: hypothetical protein U1G07_22600 [Verrucomicrobiota bacterium]
MNVTNSFVQWSVVTIKRVRRVLVCLALISLARHVDAVPVHYDFEWPGSAVPPSPAIFGSFTLDLQSSALGLFTASTFAGTADGVPWTDVSFSALPGTLPSLLIVFGGSSWRWSGDAIGGGVIQQNSTAVLEWDHFVSGWIASSSFRIWPPPQSVPEVGPPVLAVAMLLGWMCIHAMRRRKRQPV